VKKPFAVAFRWILISTQVSSVFGAMTPLMILLELVMSTEVFDRNHFGVLETTLPPVQ